MMDAHDPWANVRAARIPAAELRALAPLRTRSDVTILFINDSYWIRWTDRGDDIIRCLHPVPGVSFRSRNPDGSWSRFRSRIPTADAPPDQPGIPLIQILQPDRVSPTPQTNGSLPPLAIRLVRNDVIYETTTLACRIADLAVWAESVTTKSIEQFTAANCRDRVIVRGAKLPTIANADRFSGQRLFVPIGFRVEPNLPEALLLQAIGATDAELAMITDCDIDLIPLTAFGPLSRSAIRLAGGAT